MDAGSPVTLRSAWRPSGSGGPAAAYTRLPTRTTGASVRISR